MTDFVGFALWVAVKLPLIAYLAIALFHRAVRPAAFPLVVAGLAAIAFNLPQGRQLFFVLVENINTLHYRMTLWGASGLLLLSLICWYTARRILYVPPDTDPNGPTPRAAALRQWWPRLAAALPWLGGAAALVSYPAADPARPWAVVLAMACVGIAGSLVWLLWQRGRRLSLVGTRFTPNDGNEAITTWNWLIAGVGATVAITGALWFWVGGVSEIVPILGTYLGLFLVFLVPHQIWLRWSALQRATHRLPTDGRSEPIVHGPLVPWYMTGALGLAWIVLTWLAPVQRTTAFGTLGLADLGALAIFCLGLSGVVLFFSALSFWVARDRHLSGAAVAAGLLLWAFFLAGTTLSDNHALWRSSVATHDGPRKTVEQHLRKWLQDRSSANGEGRNAENPLPLVLIAAHGGGLRAAYWTATTLALLEQNVPGFHCKVFALSAISGSSLGALTWHANLKRPESNRYSCQAVTDNLVAKTDDVIGHDFLAGLIAGFLGPDLTSHFVPGGIAPDRQLYFESAWADAGKSVFTTDGKPIAFRDLVRPDPESTELPALFLVAADADNGRRVIASDLAFNGADLNLLKQAVDLFAHDGSATISAVTAAGASARFPWISPQGGIPGGGHVLDGGIFEATGAEVVHELLRGLSGWCDPAGKGVLRCTPGHAATTSKEAGLCTEERIRALACIPDADAIFVRPMALQLVNAPFAGPPPSPQLLASPELFGPIIALNAARGARGDAASRTLEGDPSLFAGAGFQDQPTPFARFALDKENSRSSVTLTWTLSAERRHFMCDEAKRALAGQRDRPDDDNLTAWLGLLQDGAIHDTSLPAASDDPCLASAAAAKG